MSDSSPKVIDFAEWRDERERSASIDVRLSDGTLLRVPPPELWPDKCRSIIADQSKDDSELAKAIWGADNWKKFVADGGTTAAFSQLLIERHQASLGESSASSTS